jgi:hypothetical protein
MASVRKYLIDYEIRGTLVVEANNPQAAAAHGNAIMRVVAKGLNDETAYDADVSVSPPIDLDKKIASFRTQRSKQ